MSVMVSLLSWFLLVMAAGGGLHTNSATAEVTMASNAAAVSAYWHTMLPNTLMPAAILELLTPPAGITEHIGERDTKNVQTIGKTTKDKYDEASLLKARKMGLCSTEEANTHIVKIQNGALWRGPSKRNNVQKSILLWVLSTINNIQKRYIKKSNYWSGPPTTSDVEKSNFWWGPPTTGDAEKINWRWGPPTTADVEKINWRWGPPTTADAEKINWRWGPPTADAKKINWGWGPPTTADVEKINWGWGPPTTADAEKINWGWGPPTTADAEKINWGWGPPTTADAEKINWGWGPPTTADAEKSNFFWGPPTTDEVEKSNFFWGPPTTDEVEKSNFFWGPPTTDEVEKSNFFWIPPTTDQAEKSNFFWRPPTTNEADKSKYTSKRAIIGESHIGRVDHKHGTTMSNNVFLEEALKPGSAISCYVLPSHNTGAPLLRRDVADTVPMSTRNFTDIMTMFAPASNAMAADVWSTLDHCEHTHALKGETKGCATSVESMVEFAASVLGVSTYNLRAFSSPDAPAEGIMPARGYKVAAATRVTEAGDTITCHGGRFPFAVFMCHTLNPTRVYSVTLDVDAGMKMELLAVCHLDTLGFDPTRMPLNVKPGEAPLCHFLSRDSIIWAPAAPASGHAVA